MDIKTFEKAKDIVKKIDDCRAVLNTALDLRLKPEWMRIQVNTTKSVDGKDIDINIFANTEDNEEIIKKVVNLLTSCYEEKLEQYVKDLEEL